jgi:hypothetical protein
MWYACCGDLMCHQRKAEQQHGRSRVQCSRVQERRMDGKTVSIRYRASCIGHRALIEYGIYTV